MEKDKTTHPPAPDVLAAIERELGVSPLEFLRAWGYDLADQTAGEDTSLPERTRELIALVRRVEWNDERFEGMREDLERYIRFDKARREKGKG